MKTRYSDEALASHASSTDRSDSDREKRRRERQFHTVDVPRLRLIGFLIITVLVLLRESFVGGGTDARAWLLGGVVLAYSALSWAVLYLWFEKIRRVNLGTLFLSIDVVMFVVAIYLTGGDRSWLFFLLFIRTADQANTNFRRALGFGYLSVAMYCVMLLELAIVEHRTIAWPDELFKVMLLYAASLYVALTARAAERLRTRMVEAIRLSRDLVGRLQAQSSELDAARKEAEKASRIKSEFLANMSHEIRTPMNGIIGLTALTLESPLTPEQRDNLLMVQSSARSLLEIINDILDLSKIEAERLTIDPMPFQVRGWLAETVNPFVMKAREKGLALRTSVDDDVPDDVVADESRLRQVLNNLIGNAVKFTDRGRVEVRLHLDERTSEGALLRFAVADTGIGIPLDRQGVVFRAFTQVDSSTTRRYGGTGLGLTISRNLVAMMGGRLWVESEPNRGSTFQFTTRVAFPAPAVAARSAAAGPGVEPAGPAGEKSLRILVADDNAINQRLAARLLEKRGHVVRTVSTGREALDVLEHERFDLAIVDVQMPDLDGLTATGIIRAREKASGRHLPIVAMTAHAMSGDRERCLEAGMDGYVAKPIDPTTLAEEIHRVLSSAA